MTSDTQREVKWRRHQKLFTILSPLPFFFLPHSKYFFVEKPFPFLLGTKFFSLNSECFFLRYLKLKGEQNKRVEGRIEKRKDCKKQRERSRT